MRHDGVAPQPRPQGAEGGVDTEDRPAPRTAAASVWAGGGGAGHWSLQDAARVGALDYFGVVSAGARHPDLGPLLQHVSKTYAAGPSTAIGLPTPFVAEAAAYVNATAGHMHD